MMLTNIMKQRNANLVPGLMALPGLKNPEDWTSLSLGVISRCEELRNEVLKEAPGVGVVGLIDQMSDVVCQVADPAEFCRSVHPNPEWRRSAQRACLEIGAYITQLNADTRLLRKLHGAMKTSRTGVSWSQEALSVGHKLVLDFQKGGCSLQNGGVEELWQNEQEVCFAFDGALLNASENKYLTISAQEYANLPAASKGLFQRQSRARYATKVHYTSLGSLSCQLPSSDLRRRAYMMCYSPVPRNLELLEDLMRVRFDAAKALGYPSYAHLILQDNVSGSPGAVNSFLGSVSNVIKGPADEHVQYLSRLKGSPVDPWEIWYYNAKAQKDSMGINAVFSFPCIMEGLSQLLREAFGIILRQEAMHEGESWAPLVVKMVAESESAGLLGYVYLDLFHRPDKFMGCATYTLRCGKQLDGGTYQIPVVAMAMQLTSHQEISFSGLKTFLHEFGHALNSLVCRTEYQCLFGTRGPLDQVEVPSHFMEQYVRQPELLQLFAGVDWSGRMRSVQELKRLIDKESFGWALALQDQIQMSIVDQALFGEKPFTKGGVGKVVADVVNEHGALPFVEGTRKELWHGHFVGYGACYYSYSYARCLAAMVWDKYMAADPLCREAGEKVKKLMLAPGGARNPQKYITSILGKSSLDSVEGGWAPHPEKWLKMESSTG